MRQLEDDTIVAPITPPGRGAVGIIRVSGANCQKIAKAILGEIPKPRYAHFADFLDIDQGLVLYFPAPNSFTGEDVLELHAHGNPVILDLLLQRILQLGARLACPGEFTERAFLNGKLDLTQAEATADLINAASQEAVKAASLSLQGKFSEQINNLLAQLIQVRTQVEANIDFAEDVHGIDTKNIKSQLKQILTTGHNIQTQAQQGRLLQEGITAVIVGKPNVGKSSLLNYFTGHNSAIVTDIPGTTRDVLREAINLDGLPLHIIDTAGLRISDDQIEQEGIRRTWQEIEQADVILLLVDTDDFKFTAFQNVMDKVIIIRNKIDLSKYKPHIVKHQQRDIIYVSVKTGSGLDLLRNYIKDKYHYNSTITGIFIARRRHLAALQKVKTALLSAQKQSQFDLIAEDLRQAQNALNEITGVFYTDDLLDRIFADFCVGK